ncbi:MAG: protein kinase domain-containing protein [Brevefilum sp.]
MDLQPEAILRDRYQIIEKLGHGGMGAVYLAHDKTLDTCVAVKSNFNPQPESATQFLREAQLLAAMHHGNLPRVTDYFVIGKEQFLVMDFIPGEDLSQRLERYGRQNLEDVMAWTAQLSDALTYMHRQNPPVTHRDIKPANIKLTSEGQVVLVDFGIAKAENVEVLTAAGASGYTPGFAPPEQYGEGRTGPFSDQFSLASTLYALLTGVKPADSIQRVLGKATLIPLERLNPHVPRHISDAILKAMMLQPEMRFESIAGFQEALKNPGFRLKEEEQNIILVPRQQPSLEEKGNANRPQKDQTTPDSRKKRRRLIILGVAGGVLGLAMMGAVILLFVLQRNILIPSRHVSPTATTTATMTPTITITSTQEVALLVPSITLTAIPPTPTSSHTITPTLEPSPTPEPDWVGGSGLIAFASDRGEGDEIQIWTMRVSRDPRGEIWADSFTQLTFGPGDKDQPVWSPDGSKIAYVAFGEERTGRDIWVMNADGSDPVNISWGIGDEFDPEWSPDGERIIFTLHTRDAGGIPIYALDWIRVDGTDHSRISKDFVESDPAFSPDGSWLLYVISAQSHHYFHFRGAYDGYQTPRGFDLRDIFGEFGEVSDPDWAPSGDQFAYTRHKDSQQNITLVTYDSIQRNGVHHPSEYVLTDTNAETDAAWSPDARWLAFTSSRDDGDQEVYVMTTTGRPQVNLTQREGIDREPSWAPVMGE